MENALRGELLRNGQSPDRLSFKDWLDACESYLTDTDRVSHDVARIVHELAGAETEEQVTDAVERLNLTLEAERLAYEEQQREQHRRRGTATLLPKGTAQRAVDGFNAWTAAARAAQAAAGSE